MKPILILVIIIVLMGGAAFVVTKTVVKPAFAPTAAGDGSSAEATSAEAEPSEVYQIDDLIVNPNGTSGTRYLSTSLGLEVSTSAAAEQLKGKDLQVRDLLISILSARTVAQLTNPAERESMRKVIQQRINKMLTDGRSEEHTSELQSH